MILRNICVHYSSTSEDEAEVAWKAKKEKIVSLEDKGGKAQKRFTFFAVGDSGGASEQMDFDFSPLVHSGFVFWKTNEWISSLAPKSFWDSYPWFFIFNYEFLLLHNFQVLPEVELSCFLLQVGEFIFVFGNFLQLWFYTEIEENVLTHMLMGVESFYSI